MKLGSLFDGAGTCPLAGILNGLIPVWASEIEPFPIAVTTKNFPQMKHLGDITKLNGATIEPVDFITFGSPCQDLSVAGMRVGIGGERSGLFREAIRIFKEMRGATNGRYPRAVMWENVPGAFSSNKGEDFRLVLEEICKVKDGNATVPRPEKWSDAGLIMGDGYSVAWRVLDAQFWGIPQRRRRIFLVADFEGQRAGEILFESEGLRRNFAESDQARDSSSAAVGGSPAKAVWDARGNGNGQICPTITGDHENRITDYTAVAVDTYNGTLTGDKAKTLLAGHQDADGIPCVMFNCLQDAVSDEKVSPCLSTGNPKSGQANIGVVYAIDRAAFNQGENALYKMQIDDQGISPTLVAKGPGAVCCPVCINGDVAGTLDASYGRGCGERNGQERPVVAYPTDKALIVRRLTPKECGRLQGMPDGWCDGVPHKDAPEYKMWGNGMALPCVLYVVENVRKVLRHRELTEGDGSQ